MRRVYMTRTFARWLRNSPVSEDALCKAIAQAAAGLIDVNLGGNLFKKRVALPGRGKSGGARVLLGANLRDRWFCVYGFKKNERANIEDRERAALQKLVKSLLKLEPKDLSIAQDFGELIEICHEKKPHPK